MMYGEGTPLPAYMEANRKDKRGYPIPYIVYRDRQGRPHFTVNDAKMVKRVLLHNRCGICGNKMGDIVYFVGGPSCAFHPNGAYVDPPMHKECATYSLKVCPFLAFRKYAGTQAEYVIEKIKENHDRPGYEIKADTGVMPGKPELFVLLGTKGFVNMGDFTAPRLVKTSEEDVEFWKDGVKLDPLGKDEDYINEAILKMMGGVEDAAEAKQIIHGTPSTSMKAMGIALRY